MKIQLASTLPFTPVQLDPQQSSPRRVVGMLHEVRNGLEFCRQVYEFGHDENGAIRYQVGMSEHVAANDEQRVVPQVLCAANDSRSVGSGDLVWIDHHDTLTYKPYACVVIDAMTRLIGAWDGVVYRTPSGERLRESAFQATLRIVDACISPKDGLWIMVSITGESSSGISIKSPAVHQIGWLPVAC